MLFIDRHDAGKQLAERLLALKDENPVVLALPRGGVSVGFEVMRVILLIRPEVTIGIAKLTDLLPLECVRVLLWRPNRLRPPSDADRSADCRLRYL